MDERGLSQAELGRRVGLTRQAINHYCVGRRVPLWEDGRNLAVALDLRDRKMADFFWAMMTNRCPDEALELIVREKPWADLR